MLKQTLIILGVLVLSGGVIAILANSSQDPSAIISDDVDVVLPLERTIGEGDDLVRIVEYSDFECPACSAYAPIVKRILADFKGKVQYTYRYFPLRQIHSTAQISAQAAQAAGIQGKFWEMHDRLFAEQELWAGKSNARTIFVGYARDMGLDVGRFEVDIDSPSTENAVNTDYANGIYVGIQGTPTFFLNGKSISNPRGYDEFKSIIEQAINAK